MRVDAVCVSGTDLPAVPGRKPVRTGIDKRPVSGRVAVHPLGLDGDVQVNRKHHGGEGQAVYAYAQEDADFWIAELAPALHHLPVKDQPKVRARIEARTGVPA